MVVPAGLVNNWHRELNEVFNLDFEVFGSEGDITDRKTNAFAKHDRLIASIDTLKRPARIKRLLDAPRWDLVVFDEAHHLTAYRTGGPARYFDIAETGTRIGFITPMTHNFCESCNRVRLTCTGTLYMCLGQEDAADLRSVIRASESDGPLHKAIEDAIARKPRGHDFVIDRKVARPAVGRHMSVTGG
jgi:molybdenum cofactor biosynthesis enzyme MoaA